MSWTQRLVRTFRSRFDTLFRHSDDLPRIGHDLGQFAFRRGWFGNGGSAPGYQTLFRFHPSRHVGYVILSNVNAVLGGGDNYESAPSEIYDVQGTLVSILNPTYVIRRWTSEIGAVGALAACLVALELWAGRRKAKRREAEVAQAT